MNGRTLGALAIAFGLAGGSCDPAAEYEDPIEGVVQDLSGTFVLKSVSSGKCLDLPGSNAADGVVLNQWSCHTAANQQWQVKQLSGGVHQVISASSGKCADLYKGLPDDGTKIIQWSCSTSKTNQQWKLLSSGNNVYRLQSAKTGKCMAVAGNSTANGAVIEQRPCSSASNQKFKFSGTAGGGGGSGGSSGTGGSPGTGGSSGGGLVWRKANLTNFTSYPDPGGEECIKYNGCMWAGQFAFVSGKQPESWVKSHNIAAIHEKDASKYKLKTLRLKQGSKQIDVTVYDMCSDSDCDGCCTENAKGPGFLIDIEKYTMQRFGSGDGQVDWACLDCD